MEVFIIILHYNLVYNFNCKISLDKAVLADSVADLVMGYLLSLARKIIYTHNKVVEGKWPKIRVIELNGKSITLIGLGNIEKEVAKRANGFGMNIKGFDPYPPNNSELNKLNITKENLHEAVNGTDFIILCCNLTEENIYFMNEKIFSLLENTFLINVGRGKLINETDLIEAIQNNNIAGVALDVYENEPLPKNNKLRNLENVIFGTHSAGQTKQAVERVNKAAINNLNPLRE